MLRAAARAPVEAAEEIEALAASRTWRHIDTGEEHTDEAAVELYERVLAAS